MGFRYACFISHRHAEGELLNTAIDELYIALKDELEAYVGKNSVYCDKYDKKPGEFFPENISSALYRSVCMIAVYTPTYFDIKNTCCAREFSAMKKLEEQRLERLNLEVKKDGLIIPIVIRGLRYLPPEIKNRRQYFDFERFKLSRTKMNKHPYFSPKIKEIAEYIFDRWNTFKELGDSLFDNNENFTLPEEKEIMGWLMGIKKHQTPLSWREVNIT
jgi:hypothetical protein